MYLHDIKINYIQTKPEMELVFYFCERVDGKVILDPDFQIEVFKRSYDQWSKDRFFKYHNNEGLVEVATYKDIIVGVCCFRKDTLLKKVFIEKLVAEQTSPNYEVVISSLLINRIQNLKKQLDSFKEICITVNEDQSKLIQICKNTGFASKFDKEKNAILFTKEFS